MGTLLPHDRYKILLLILVYIVLGLISEKPVLKVNHDDRLKTRGQSILFTNDVQIVNSHKDLVLLTLCNALPMC